MIDCQGLADWMWPLMRTLIADWMDKHSNQFSGFYVSAAEQRRRVNHIRNGTGTNRLDWASDDTNAALSAMTGTPLLVLSTTATGNVTHIVYNDAAGDKFILIFYSTSEHYTSVRQ